MTTPKLTDMLQVIILDVISLIFKQDSSTCLGFGIVNAQT